MYRELESTPNLDYVKYLNKAQLLDLLEDEETIRATVRVNSKLKALQRSKAVLLSSNCWLAKQNLVYKPYLTKTKLLLAEKHQELGQLVSSIQHKESKLVYMADIQRRKTAA
nr:vacuolar protein sorting-associated protein 37D-like isoform X2 [Misgurnus anguillicaudatus]